MAPQTDGFAWQRPWTSFRQRPIGVQLLWVGAILSVVVLIWSANWVWSVGVHASDTNTSGGNAAAWLWFLGSGLVFLASTVTLVVLAARPSRRQPASLSF